MTVPHKLLKEVIVKSHVRKTDEGKVSNVRRHTRLDEVNEKVNIASSREHLNEIIASHGDDLGGSNEHINKDNIQDVVTEYNSIFNKILSSEKVKSLDKDDIIKFTSDYFENLRNIQEKNPNIDILNGIDFDQDFLGKKLLPQMIFENASSNKYNYLFSPNDMGRIQEFLDKHKENKTLPFTVGAGYFESLCRHPNNHKINIREMFNKFNEDNNLLGRDFMNILQIYDDHPDDIENLTQKKKKYFKSMISKDIGFPLKGSYNNVDHMVRMENTLMDRFVIDGYAYRELSENMRRSLFQIAFSDEPGDYKDSFYPEMQGLAYKSDNPKKQQDTFSEEIDNVGLSMGEDLRVHDFINHQYKSSNEASALLFRRSYNDIYYEGRTDRYEATAESKTFFPVSNLTKDQIPQNLLNSFNEIYELTKKHMDGEYGDNLGNLYRGMNFTLPLNEENKSYEKNLHICSSVVSTTTNIDTAKRFAHYNGDSPEANDEASSFKSLTELSEKLKSYGINFTISDGLFESGLLDGCMGYLKEKDTAWGKHLKVKLVSEFDKEKARKKMFMVLTGTPLNDIKKKYYAIRFKGNDAEHVVLT